MNRIIIESPWRGATLREELRNSQYARRALKHSIELGEAPFASHMLYTQVLNDHRLDERELGMKAGWAWIDVADYLVFYNDYGMSIGMQAALQYAGTKLHYFRQIGRNPGDP